MNKYNFSERLAIVTGGAQGFGLAITKRIIQSGGKVIIWDIDKKEAEKHSPLRSKIYREDDMPEYPSA